MTGGEIVELVVVAAVALIIGFVFGRRSGAGAPARSTRPRIAARCRRLPEDRISIEALSEPALVVAGDIAVAANAAARRLFGDRVAGSDLRLTVRHPVILDALAEAREMPGSVEREIAGLGSGNSAWRLHAVDAGRGPRPGLVRRHHPGPADRAHARRFRCQRQPRIAHPARDPVGLHRNAARARPRATNRRASAFSTSWRWRRGACRA